MVTKEQFIEYLGKTQESLSPDNFYLTEDMLKKIDLLYTTSNGLYVYGIARDGVFELQKCWEGDKYKLLITNYYIYRDYHIVDEKLCMLRLLCHKDDIYIAPNGGVYQKLYV